MTDWTLHFSLRPIELPHSGHGKAVLFLLTSGSPDDVQITALPDIALPRWGGRTTPPF